jgi:solute carrier family 25 protein 38
LVCCPSLSVQLYILDSAIGEHHKASANFYAGAFSGLVSTLCLQPLDVVKTRMQQGSQYIVSPNVTLRRVLSPRNPLSIAASIVSDTGVFSLWRGTSPTIIRNCLGVGVYFVSLNAITNILQHSGDCDTHMPAWKTLLAGGLSRSLSATLLCPLSVLKTRYEAQVIDQRQGVFGALVEVYKKERFRGLFSGLVPTIVRDAPYSASYFLIYLRVRESLSSLVSPDNISKLSPTLNASYSPSEHHMITMSVSFVAGLVGGFAATFLTQPQDVIKTRMQLRVYAINQAQRKASILETISLIYREEGLSGFFRGALPRFFKRCLGSAITWMIYEEFVSIFDKLLSEKTQRQSSQHVRAFSILS